MNPYVTSDSKKKETKKCSLLRMILCKTKQIIKKNNSYANYFHLTNFKRKRFPKSTSLCYLFFLIDPYVF